MTASFVHKRGLIPRHDVRDAYITQTIHILYIYYKQTKLCIIGTRTVSGYSEFLSGRIRCAEGEI